MSEYAVTLSEEQWDAILWELENNALPYHEFAKLREKEHAYGQVKQTIEDLKRQMPEAKCGGGA